MAFLRTNVPGAFHSEMSTERRPLTSPAPKWRLNGPMVSRQNCGCEIVVSV